jgi:hypothetical protein
MRIVTSPRAAAYIGQHGGSVWVWLDPHRAFVGSYVWLEAHCEPPRSSRRSKFTRASRRPHTFKRLEQDGHVIHYAFGTLGEPEELHFDRKGWRPGTYRLEAYWNGSVFVDGDIPPPVRP